MTRDEIIASIREANLQGRWPELCERLQQMDGHEVFHVLFPLAVDRQLHGPACDAACLLFAVKPDCPVSCTDALRTILPTWDINLQEVPWYLANYFGEETIREAFRELREEPRGEWERVSLIIVRERTEIFFTFTPDQVRECKRRAWRLNEGEEANGPVREPRRWSPRAETLVSRLIAELPGSQLDPARTHAARLNALPIGGSMWADYYLRANGAVVIVGEDFDHPEVDSVYSDWRRVLPVLVWGSRRYPELRELLPVRTPHAVDCRCRAIPMFAEGKVLCPECGGLGWVQGGDG
jgi:hypothetical protein